MKKSKWRFIVNEIITTILFVLTLALFYIIIVMVGIMQGTI